MAQHVVIHDIDRTDELAAAVVTSVDTPSKAGLASVNPDGTTQAKEATQAKRYGGSKLAVSGTLITSGDNVVITPASGKAITIYWVAIIPSSDNTAANLFQVKFSDGQVPYTGYAVAHWEPFTGAANATVIINLANTQPVAYTIHYTTT